MKCMKLTATWLALITMAGVSWAGSLSFSRPGVVFLPTQAQLDATEKDGTTTRWRDSEISVVLRFESSRYGEKPQSVRLALVRGDETVKLGILGSNQQLGDSANVAPDTHTILTLVVPKEQLAQWKQSMTMDSFENWSLILTHNDAPRGISVGTVRVAHVER